MSNDPSITLHTKFRRNMKLADYEMAEAEVLVAQEFPGDMPPEDVQAHIAGMFQYAKASVYDQLGLGYNQDEATGIIMEVFPGTQVVGSKPKALPAAQKPRKSAAAPKSIPEPYTDEDEPPVDAYEEDEPPARPPARQNAGRNSASRTSSGRSAGRPSASAKAMTTDELWEHLEQNPGEWFDNRESKTNPKAPDFRAKNLPQPGNPQYKAGLWLRDAPDWFENPFD